MKFGISLVPDGSPETKDPKEYYDDVLRLCELSDAAGLEWVKMTEHYLHPYGGYCPDPLAFLAAVAVRTERIRLMTGGVIPVFHHPVILASRAAMIDVLSGGRLDLGFARGYLPYEHDTFAVPMAESHERYEAAVGAITRLLTEDRASEDTPFFSYTDAVALPRPVQDPIPLWSAAVRTEKSFLRLAELGHGLLATPMFKPLDLFRQHSELYRGAYAAAGHARPGQIAAGLPVFVAESDKEAQEVGDRLFQHYLDAWVDAANSWNDVESGSFAGYTDMGKRLGSMTATQWREFGSAFFGSPERVIDQIRAFQENSGGVDGIIAQVDFGAVSGEVMERSVRLFIDEVVPAVSDL
ncbi:luciferase [Longispora fulva]|uniref:Alkanesulfonate monooxygenase SsuD/methylene tetrahydromethanopterin reductase-like flavin-dependent oxidoreductase (Luciferase family) n=1 Tax=Longispora fulva TaxID=619741 RepID=A0A8J7G7J1_9ACTN|nr:LLM class flavin-dependent oxidoreductase [Longispora fulva]MBG6134350.1 alkanesulfonate monooxygenase SsuD/methylene tetrahydromethanopterin reductase-like flavin-dependent oxidoreductase (luciferase family) [Longispora fulva]GIG63059.1 luciferase [Longispora fulva]